MNLPAYYGIKRLYPRLGKLGAYLSLVRPFTCIVAFVAGISLNYLFASLSRIEATFGLSLAVGLTLALLHGGSQSWQQSVSCEIEIDKINKPYRAIPSGIIKPEEGKIMSVALFSLAVAIAFTISTTFLLFVIITLLFAIFYVSPPIRVKRIFVVNNLWQGISRGLLPMLCVSSIYACEKLALAYGVPLTIWVAGAQATKDFTDVEGDRKFGIMTFPVKLGITNAIKAICIFVIASFVILVTFSVFGVLPKSFLLISVLSIPSALMVYFLKKGTVIEKMENNAGWCMFYLTLGLFYIVPVLTCL